MYFAPVFSPVAGPGMGKSKGGDRARTADPGCPQEYSIPFNVVPSNEMVEEEEGCSGFQGRFCSETGWTLSFIEPGTLKLFDYEHGLSPWLFTTTRPRSVIQRF